MATIVPIGDRWRATVRRKRDGRMVLNRSKTFTTEREATQWAAQMEKRLTSDAAVDDVAGQVSRSGWTAARLIERHIEYYEPLRPMGETKRYILAAAAREPWARKPLEQLRPADLLAWLVAMRSAGRSPATVAQYVGYVRQVFALAKPTFGVVVPASLFSDIAPVLKAGKVVGQGAERDRRLQPGEWRKLLTYFKQYDRTRSRTVRVVPLLRFLVRLPLRLGEACNMLWADIDAGKRTVILRDRKDPQAKAGNDQVVPLLGRSWAIVQAMPRMDARVFPYRTESLSGLFARACEVCGIADLHLHDLRHEGTSRLFERGYQIQEVALITGHKKWDTLRRYTQLKPESLHR